jgi:hypothetical protein
MARKDGITVAQSVAQRRSKLLPMQDQILNASFEENQQPCSCGHMML